MGEKALWPVAAVVSTALVVMGTLLALGVDVADIISCVSICGTFISLMLYNKVSQVEKNTNGASTQDKAMIRDLVDYVKKSTPITKDD